MSSVPKKHRFMLEEELVQELLNQLGKGSLAKEMKGISVEFDYVSGRTDVIAVCDKKNNVYAFEAKLKNWKVALHQARRNTCYAHYTYVVLPHVARAALNNAVNFRKFGVGLIFITQDSTMLVAVKPLKHKPLMPWVTSRAVASTLSSTDELPPSNYPRSRAKRSD